ncbi:MAG: TIGR02647 family protein [SAR86 cluster bacterium]|uniref:TIGR02647 family protein n=1 Tax=SAR86 cluster bacterium TaxID=2030880 RepID=A0A2A4MG26_9GAMM|nr:MAG: TIGR02647 family protein [SAR86 cluster bacterium]
MQLNPELMEEMELLNLFNLDSSQEGLKIHHQAAPERIAAAQRLFDKNLISLVDGGYLSAQGIEAAEHTKSLLVLLKSDT